MIKTDCRQFPLDRPCKLHKTQGTHCAECTEYRPFFAQSPTKKILIVKLGAMGDVLRTTFLLPGLKEKYPDSEITWIVAPQSVRILESNPYLHRIVAYDKNTLSLLTMEKFDIVINLDLAPESLALATAAFAVKRIGYWLNAKRQIRYSNGFARRWLQMSAFDDLKKANDRTYQHWMASIVELPRSDYEIYTPLLKESIAKAEKFRRAHKLARTGVVGINPGASQRWKLKKWTNAGYVKIIERLLASGKQILLLGGPDEKELIEYLVKKTGNRVVNTGTDNSLPDFFALLNLADLLITGDTLAMHAAMGLGKKAVAIFGPTSAAEIELYGRGTKVITPAPCACCYRTSCEVRPDCMKQITPAMVWTAIESQLTR